MNLYTAHQEIDKLINTLENASVVLKKIIEKLDSEIKSDDNETAS